MMDTPGSKFQLSCLCFWHSVTKNSKSSLGPVFRCLVYLTVFFKDLYISFLFRVNEDTITHGLSSEWKHRLDEQLLFFLLSMLSLRICVVNCSVKVEVFRSPGSRGPRSDLVLVPLFRFFAFHLSFLFLFYFIWATTFQLLSCTLWYKTHK